MIGDLFVIGFDQISDHPSDQTGDTNGSIRIRSISDGSPDIRFDRISEHTSTSNASENNLKLTKEALKKEILSLEKIHRLDNENLQYKDETNFSNVIEN